MQAVSGQYKEMMKRKWINRLCHMRVSIGVINQEAQASAQVPDQENYEYYSDFYKPLNNYAVKENELYAACDESYTRIDEGMFFLPREKNMAVLNQGIITEQIKGSIRFTFPIPQDIKGLTIEFGHAWPVNFVIRSDHQEVQIVGNNAGYFTTDEVFEESTYLEIQPSLMRYGNNRLRIHQITMGIGIYFSGHEIKSATQQEYVSPINEELPTMDFSLTVENRSRRFDIENVSSSVNFLEAGQIINVQYGQELDDGMIEWIPKTALLLKDWKVNDVEMSFSASDRFIDLNENYYRGVYHPEGISLYELAVDVLEDARIDFREVWLDPYLRDVLINNPMPVVTHKEALQLIANAGRCVLAHGRSCNIYMRSSFTQELIAGSDHVAYYSNPGTILNGKEKIVYASTFLNYTRVDSGVCFLPREGTAGAIQDAGYVSEQMADDQGKFSQNPSVTICAEAAYKCFGLTINFGENFPKELQISVFYEGVCVENYPVSDVSRSTVIAHEFPEWDVMKIEVCRGAVSSGVVLHNILFGESTDYVLEYGSELKKAPTGKQLQKVKEIQVVRTLYSQSQAADVELAREKISISAADNRYTLYFRNPSYGLSCTVIGAMGSARILESSSYYATIELSGIREGIEIEVAVYGREYVPSYALVSRQLHNSGVQEVWDNPLISDLQHAVKLADWIGDYLKTGKEYEISYRGDARVDGNDLMILENQRLENMKIRVYKHVLEYNGTLSGRILARRVE